MWVGWNSRLNTDELPMQNVCYMENICLPPTRHDVMVKTMEVSQNVAEEVNQDAMVVHYDLAIAKIARALKDMERPRFDNVLSALVLFTYKWPTSRLWVILFVTLVDQKS